MWEWKKMNCIPKSAGPSITLVGQGRLCFRVMNDRLVCPSPSWWQQICSTNQENNHNFNVWRRNMLANEWHKDLLAVRKPKEYFIFANKLAVTHDFSFLLQTNLCASNSWFPSDLRAHAHNIVTLRNTLLVPRASLSLTSYVWTFLAWNLRWEGAKVVQSVSSRVHEAILKSSQQCDHTGLASVWSWTAGDNRDVIICAIIP